jgi:hypothetical protein
MPRIQLRIFPTDDVRDLARQVNEQFAILNVELQRLESLDGYKAQFYGDVEMNENKITELADGVDGTDAANVSQT